jgi:endonuclease YncB( thermonuclease family)
MNLLRIMTRCLCATPILLAGCFAAAGQAAKPAPVGTCEREIIGDASVASVIDGRTIVSADGREIRLIGIEAPPDPAPLRALIGGKTVTLKGLGQREDRYGRIRAYVYLGDTSIQQQLVREGHAYASPRGLPKPCADELWAAEREARRNARGLWAEAELGPKSAANRDEILRAKGRFALVTGKVLSVREFGGTIYLNFGRRYTRDFSVAIAQRDARKFALAPTRLQDKTILVRGVVEERGGPMIEVNDPQQIELIQ